MVRVATLGPESIATRFRAMGTQVHIVATDLGESELELARDRIDDLERRWSRFIASSELNAVNRSAGRPVIVSEETFDLIARSVLASRLTDGKFDPSVERAMVANGYDCDFDHLTGVVNSRILCPAPGIEGIDLIPAIGAVSLPIGTTLDFGGIGKGLAADLVAGLLIDLGAEGAMVNMGGDLRAIGQASDAQGWVISVPDPFDQHRELLRFAMPEGAVATSSQMLRRWATKNGEAHHLIDPSTGAPLNTDVALVTVIAAEAWWAEVLTKSLFISGPLALEGLSDTYAVMVMSDGSIHCSPGADAVIR